MHKTALLEAEVRELREANATLSQNKRKKRTRLQDSGKITIGNSQSQIDQMDVDMQVVAESSRNGGRGRLEGLKVRHCSKCGKAGHNIRTCREVIKVTEEEENN
jgi:FtsZ-binding cell division protein ZapB